MAASVAHIVVCCSVFFTAFHGFVAFQVNGAIPEGVQHGHSLTGIRQHRNTRQLVEKWKKRWKRNPYAGYSNSRFQNLESSNLYQNKFGQRANFPTQNRGQPPYNAYGQNPRNQQNGLYDPYWNSPNDFSHRRNRPRPTIKPDLGSNQLYQPKRIGVPTRVAGFWGDNPNGGKTNQREQAILNTLAKKERIRQFMMRPRIKPQANAQYDTAQQNTGSNTNGYNNDAPNQQQYPSNRKQYASAPNYGNQQQAPNRYTDNNPENTPLQNPYNQPYKNNIVPQQQGQQNPIVRGALDGMFLNHYQAPNIVPMPPRHNQNPAAQQASTNNNVNLQNPLAGVKFATTPIPPKKPIPMPPKSQAWLAAHPMKEKKKAGMNVKIHGLSVRINSQAPTNSTTESPIPMPPKSQEWLAKQKQEQERLASLAQQNQTIEPTNSTENETYQNQNVNQGQQPQLAQYQSVGARNNYQNQGVGYAQQAPRNGVYGAGTDDPQGNYGQVPQEGPVNQQYAYQDPNVYGQQQQYPNQQEQQYIQQQQYQQDQQIYQDPTSYAQQPTEVITTLSEIQGNSQYGNVNGQVQQAQPQQVGIQQQQQQQQQQQPQREVQTKPTTTENVNSAANDTEDQQEEPQEHPPQKKQPQVKQQDQQEQHSQAQQSAGHENKDNQEQTTSSKPSTTTPSVSTGTKSSQQPTQPTTDAATTKTVSAAEKQQVLEKERAEMLAELVKEKKDNSNANELDVGESSTATPIQMRKKESKQKEKEKEDEKNEAEEMKEEKEEKVKETVEALDEMAKAWAKKNNIKKRKKRDVSSQHHSLTQQEVDDIVRQQDAISNHKSIFKKGPVLQPKNVADIIEQQNSIASHVRNQQDGAAAIPHRKVISNGKGPAVPMPAKRGNFYVKKTNTFIAEPMQEVKTHRMGVPKQVAGFWEDTPTGDDNDDESSEVDKTSSSAMTQRRSSGSLNPVKSDAHVNGIRSRMKQLSESNFYKNRGLTRIANSHQGDTAQNYIASPFEGPGKKSPFAAEQLASKPRTSDAVDIPDPKSYKSTYQSRVASRKLVQAVVPESPQAPKPSHTESNKKPSESTLDQTASREIIQPDIPKPHHIQSSVAVDPVSNKKTYDSTYNGRFPSRKIFQAQPISHPIPKSSETIAGDQPYESTYNAKVPSRKIFHSQSNIPDSNVEIPVQRKVIVHNAVPKPERLKKVNVPKAQTLGSEKEGLIVHHSTAFETSDSIVSKILKEHEARLNGTVSVSNDTETGYEIFKPSFYTNIMKRYRSRDAFWAALCLATVLFVMFGAVWYSKMWRKKDGDWDLGAKYQPQATSIPIGELIRQKLGRLPRLKTKLKRKKKGGVAHRYLQLKRKQPVGSSSTDEEVTYKRM